MRGTGFAPASEVRILAALLALTFAAEVGVMFLLPAIFPSHPGGWAEASVDALLLDLLLAPILWWLVVRPLKSVALGEQQRTLAVMRSAFHGVITVDEHASIESVNPAAERIFGYGEEELLGKPVALLMPERYREAHRTAVERRRSTGTPRVTETSIEAHGVRKDGSEFPLELSMAAWQNAGASGYAAFVRDITLRKRAEDELLRLKKAVEASPEVIFLTDAAGTIRFVNPAFVRLYGYQAEEVVGLTTPRILKGGQTSPEGYEQFWKSIRRKETVKGEFINKTKHGRLLPVESSVSPVLDEHDGIAGFVAVQADITTRLQAERALQASEERYRTVVQNVDEIVYVIEMDSDLPAGRLAFVSDRIEGLTGYTPQDFLDQPDLWRSLIHPDDQSSVASITAQVLADRMPATRRYRLRHRQTGTYRWVSDRVAPHMDGAGTQLRLFGVARDITDRVLAEDRVRDSEAALKEAQRIAHVGSWEWNVETDTTVWSEERCRIFGHDPTLPTPGYGESLKLYSPESAVQLDLAVRHALKTGAPFERDLEVVRADGTRRSIIARGEVQRDAAGRIIGLRGTTQDVTERRRAEEKLQESEDRYREMFMDDLTGAYVSTPAGALLACNPAFASTFGFESVESAQRAGILAICDVPEDRELFLSRLRLEQRIEYSRAEYRRQDGTPVHVIENAVGVFDDAGELVEIRGYLIDTSQLRHLEDQLRQVQKMEAVGRLAGGIAHDFNNILSEIVGYGEFVCEGLAQGDPRREDMLQVLAAAHRAAGLTRQLLTFSRQKPTEKRPTDLDDRLAQLTPFLRRTIGETIELSVVQAGQPVVVNIDPVQFEQVVMNLVVNARDAMPAGGELRLALQPARSRVRLTVADTGLGMDGRTQQHIFEPFFTTKAVGKGTGLGLATCFGIVEDAGGTIAVTSSPGHGSTFVVNLPLVPGGVGSARPEAPAPPSRPGQGEEVLLCEDEPGLLRLGRRVLEDGGYLVHTATDGNDAIRCIDELGTRLAVIVTDVVMPGCSGEAVAAHAARVVPRVPVLLTSGYFDDTTHRAERAGPILWKPVQPTDLLQAVARALAGPASHDRA